MTPWTPELRERHGIAAGNARARTDDELDECVAAWIGKKFGDERVRGVRERLWPEAPWDFGLVIGQVRHPEEIAAIRARGIRVFELASVLDELTGPEADDGPVKKTSSTAADIAALIEVDRRLRPG